MPNLVDLD